MWSPTIINSKIVLNGSTAIKLFKQIIYNHTVTQIFSPQPLLTTCEVCCSYLQQLHHASRRPIVTTCQLLSQTIHPFHWFVEETQLPKLSTKSSWRSHTSHDTSAGSRFRIAVSSIPKDSLSGKNHTVSIVRGSARNKRRTMAKFSKNCTNLDQTKPLTALSHHHTHCK